MVVLLIIIYLAFISLGLPDSLLGSAWPSMYEGLGVSIESAGIISMIVSVGTVISSLLSDRLIRRFSTAMVTVVSVAMTAIALFGFSVSNYFAMLCIFAIPLGLGAGAIDAALNNFVAIHYKAKHMSWLHCFWGVGASLGPVIMAFCLVQTQSWNIGYRTISMLQILLLVILLCSLPLWRKVQFPISEYNIPEQRILSKKQLLSLPGAKQLLIAFFCYCGIESTVGLWGSSYLVTVRGIPVETAASWISLYFIGITVGRLFSGFFAIKLNNKQMVAMGQILVAGGIIVLLLPFGGYAALMGLFLIGLGLAPIYPSLLHQTPINFGNEYSQSMIGLEMACAYIGTMLMPPLFGIIGANISYKLFPFFLGVLLLLMILMVAAPNKQKKSKT